MRWIAYMLYNPIENERGELKRSEMAVKAEPVLKMVATQRLVMSQP